jgi:anaerobic ribonucleoside-triphosphate reductase activating protein
VLGRSADKDFVLNVAATCVGTRSLGPGYRAVVWVQGCPFTCTGCVAPDWIPDRPARLVDPVELADELLADADVTGLTFSGGEPMAQAAELATLARAARARRDVSIVCFTGFTLPRLRSRPPNPGVVALLSEVDVLIDGQYVAARNDDRGLRGSTNQVVHHLTDRLADVGYDFENRPRSAEIRVGDRDVTLIGVPTAEMLATLDRVLDETIARRSDS